MSSLLDVVAKLEVNVQELIQKKQDLEAKVEALEARNTNLQGQSESLEKAVEQLEEKNKILRIAGGNSGEGQREIKLKINEIVREVDKCIAQLNQ
jgi:chromosome segregation ATPase